MPKMGMDGSAPGAGIGPEVQIGEPWAWGPGVSKAVILRLWNPDDRRCAQCWNPVELMVQWDGSAELVCPNGCEPGGHVSEIYVRYERMRMDEIARQVARNYPDLAVANGVHIRTGDEICRDVAALFGEDEDMKSWIRANHPGQRRTAPVAPPPRRDWSLRVRAFRPRPSWRPKASRQMKGGSTCLSKV